MTLEKYLIEKNCLKLNDFSKVTDGEHGSVQFLDSGIKYLMAENIKKGYVDISNIRYVSKEVDIRNKRASVNIGDILISIKGTLGEVALAEDWLLPANLSRDVAIIKPNNLELIKHEYLALFLMSKYGVQQSQRGGSGGVQQMITLERLREFSIPILQSQFQDKIKILYQKSLNSLKQSQSLYTEAETHLLSELGLKDWKPTEETESVKRFSESFGQSGRLDAEYYQPKYDELLNHISKYPTKKLNTIVNIKKSIEPGSDAYLDNGIPFIRVANLSKYGLTEPEIHLDRKFYELMDLKPKKDTILLSKDGSVGIAYKLEKNLDAITSGAILHLTIKDENFLPDYLTLVLNSIIVWFQAERDAGGSIIQHWKPSEIEQVIIPKIDKTIQQNITEKIQQSFALKAQSRQLLDLARRGVEMAIEQGEDAAMEWMKEEIEKLGVLTNA